jgi:peptidoglycan/xylan/chitin deacetylase (PgdA/CDA1 family)
MTGSKMGRRAARSGAASVISRFGGLRALDAKWGTTRLTVLAYHRVTPRPAPDFPYLPDVVSVSPAGFSRHVKWIRRNFTVIGLDDLLGLVRDGLTLPPRPLLFTFDDGYLDNYEHAFPVLRAHGLPAVLFVVSGAIGENRLMWWDELASLVQRTPLRSAVLPLVGPVDLSGSGRRAAVRGELLGRLKTVPDSARRDSLRELAEALRVEPLIPQRSLFITWDQAREMIAHGVAVQPHTRSHPILTRVDPETLRAELADSARAVRKETGLPARAFAYPNGTASDINADVVRAVADAGFEVAFTMEPGPMPAAAVRANPLQIARVPVMHTDTFPTFQLKTMGWGPVTSRIRRRMRRSHNGA